MTILLIVMELGKFIRLPGHPRGTGQAARAPSSLYHNYNRLPAPMPVLFIE